MGVFYKRPVKKAHFRKQIETRRKIYKKKQNKRKFQQLVEYM